MQQCVQTLPAMKKISESVQMIKAKETGKPSTKRSSSAKSAPQPVPMRKITIMDIVDQAERVETVISNVRDRLLAPSARKSPPTFSMTQVAELCNLEKAQCAYWMSKDILPPGQLNETGTRREFTLKEARVWVRHHRGEYMRPDGTSAVVVTVASFKGGVTKTSTAVMMAQALSLKGMKVLLIDLDPQGSATTLMGISPETEVDEDKTAAEVFYGDKSSIVDAIQPTYWDGIDIVAASGALFNIEFFLPATQANDPKYEFWSVLDKGLSEAKQIYDVILIDTPPSLSYSTVNALMAADGLVVPIPPSSLDFASSSQFWAIYGELASQLVKERKVNKSYDFIHVLLARVDSSDLASTLVRGWINTAYGDKVLPVEIPKTTVTSSSSAEYNTVYDITKYEGNARTYKRAREAYDRLADYLEQSIRAAWAGQL